MIKRSLVTFFGLLVAMQLVPGIDSSGLIAALAAAFVLSIFNLTLKPLLVLLTLPVTLLSLGLFLLVINAILLGFTAWLVPGFHVLNFGSALIGSVVLSLVTLIVNSMIKDNR
jgi:putative membrane protein